MGSEPTLRMAPVPGSTMKVTLRQAPNKTDGRAWEVWIAGKRTRRTLITT